MVINWKIVLVFSVILFAVTFAISRVDGWMIALACVGGSVAITGLVVLALTWAVQ